MELPCGCNDMITIGEILYKDFLAQVRRSLSGGSPRRGRNDDRDDDRRGNSSRRKPGLNVKLDRSVMSELAKLPGGKRLSQALEEFDRKGTGRLTRENFRSALHEGCKLDLLEREWRQLLEQFDPDDKGYMNIDDFLAWTDDNREGGEAPARKKGSQEEEGSYVGKRKGTMEPEEAVEVSVHELRVTDRSLVRDIKGDDVYVAYRFLEDKKHISGRERLRDTGEVDLGFVKTFPVPKGSDLRDALVEELTSAGGSKIINFTVYNRRGGGRNR